MEYFSGQQLLIVSFFASKCFMNRYVSVHNSSGSWDPAGQRGNLLDDVIKWKHFPRNWPFVRGIHRSPVISPHKGQWRGVLVFSLIGVWINDWVNNDEAGDLRRYRAHYDVIVMIFMSSLSCTTPRYIACSNDYQNIFIFYFSFLLYFRIYAPYSILLCLSLYLAKSRNFSPGIPFSCHWLLSIPNTGSLVRNFFEMLTRSCNTSRYKSIRE